MRFSTKRARVKPPPIGSRIIFVSRRPTRPASSRRCVRRRSTQHRPEDGIKFCQQQLRRLEFVTRKTPFCGGRRTRGKPDEQKKVSAAGGRRRPRDATFRQCILVVGN